MADLAATGGTVASYYAASMQRPARSYGGPTKGGDSDVRGRGRVAVLAVAAAGAVMAARRRPSAVGHRWFARLYDALARLAERGELGRRRHDLLTGARGRVLDLGSGTGENFKHYRDVVDVVVAVEPDPHMRRRGLRRAPESGAPVLHVAAAGEALPFRDAAFETVVATLVLCSVHDPDATEAEVRRVLAPAGRLLVLEHVRATSPRLAGWQDRLERPWAAVAGGCRPNRDTGASLRAAGFDVTAVERFTLRPSIPLVAPHVQGLAEPA